MKFFLSILLIGALSAVSEYFLPWWTMSIVAFLVCLVMRMGGWRSFFAGFLGIAVFWLCAFLFRDVPNEHILSQRMAILFFKKPAGSQFMLVTVMLGAIIGGLAGWSGGLMLKRNTKKIY